MPFVSVAIGPKRASPEKTTRWRHEAQTSSFAPRWWFPPSSSPSSSLFINSFISFFSSFLLLTELLPHTHTATVQSVPLVGVKRRGRSRVPNTSPVSPEEEWVIRLRRKDTHTHTYREKEVVPSRFFFNTHDQKEKKKRFLQRHLRLCDHHVFFRPFIPVMREWHCASRYFKRRRGYRTKILRPTFCHDNNTTWRMDINAQLLKSLKKKKMFLALHFFLFFKIRYSRLAVGRGKKK